MRYSHKVNTLSRVKIELTQCQEKSVLLSVCVVVCIAFTRSNMCGLVCVNSSSTSLCTTQHGSILWSIHLPRPWLRFVCTDKLCKYLYVQRVLNSTLVVRNLIPTCFIMASLYKKERTLQRFPSLYTPGEVYTLIDLGFMFSAGLHLSRMVVGLKILSGDVRGCCHGCLGTSGDLVLSVAVVQALVQTRLGPRFVLSGVLHPNRLYRSASQELVRWWKSHTSCALRHPLYRNLQLWYSGKIHSKYHQPRLQLTSGSRR